VSRRRTVVVTLLGIAALALPAAATAAPPPPAEPSAPYRVAGFGLRPLPELAAPPSAGLGQFPAGFGDYHTYGELRAELVALAAAHPDVVRVSSYGTSLEGRALPLVKVSDSVATDEAEPEVLFSCGQHAREHLTVEMCLHIVTRLVEGHGNDPALTALVDSREVWVMPMTNPDGAEFDIATGAFAQWRKNRQPTPGSIAIGTDLNRNWGTQWGCCGGSSDSPFADDYRGPAPFSAPETAQLRDWVGSRVIGGEQQITTHIDWHAFSELVLWPYGFTESGSAPGLDAEAAATFRALGEAMAAKNGYTPQQSSDFYVTDGTINDWMWAEHGIWSYTFEMYPSSQEQGGFYPTDNVIGPQTSRNDAAVDLLLGYANCAPRIIGVTC